MRLLPWAAAGVLLAPGGALGSPAGFWDEVLQPGLRPYNQAMSRGRAVWRQLARARRAARAQGGPGDLRSPGGGPPTPGAGGGEGLEEDRQRALCHRGLQAFGQASAALPLEGLPHYWIGRLLLARARAGGPAQPGPVVRAFTRARQLGAQLSQAQQLDLAEGLALAYTAQGDYALAVAEVDRALEALGGEGSWRLRKARAHLLYNSAEWTMAQGQLEEALRRYELAVSLDSAERLYALGLAVALDRDGRQDRALALARRALSRDPGMSLLTQPGVFFVPPGDLSYYRALGHQALGEDAAARAQYRRFLEDLPHSPWAARARAHLAQAAAVDAGRAPPGRAPRTGTTGADQAAYWRSRLRSQLGRGLQSVNDCYARALKGDGRLEGRLRLRLAVGADGQIRQARITSGTLEDRAMRRCVLRALREARLSPPGTGEPVVLRYTFEFKPAL